MMLAGSNLVMNVAWYGHLKVPDRALWLAILLSWGLALFEYCLVVPAVRIGSAAYTLPQLKTIQLFMSASTFVLMAWYVFGQKPSLAQLGGFALIVCGAALIFSGK
ncbi:DMT family protein [Novosphingobium sp. H3SJ31-1]|uniref:DMT family protein n=1 Tax=Novosphingobium album (ex Liu et al. 2023) TaxID=3031130 RepID=A0ABT5WX24_9SPHN|nr:DMT family protein [Novosphingobium album (ex Liu et al. 2023)]